MKLWEEKAHLLTTVFTRVNIDSKCVLLVLQAPVPWIFSKLDGVGPVDNRPSTDKLCHIVKKKKKKEKKKKKK